jgi:hypothetical protein
LRVSGCHPSGCTDFVSDHGEKLVIIFQIIFKELLRKCLRLLGTGACWQLRDSEIKSRRLIRVDRRDDPVYPDGDEPAVRRADRNASRVDEKIKLLSAKERNPFKPLNTSSYTCCVDGSWRETVRRKSEATAT